MICGLYYFSAITMMTRIRVFPIYNNFKLFEYLYKMGIYSNYAVK